MQLLFIFFEFLNINMGDIQQKTASTRTLYADKRLSLFTKSVCYYFEKEMKCSLVATVESVLAKGHM